MTFWRGISFLWTNFCFSPEKQNLILKKSFLFMNSVSSSSKIMSPPSGFVSSSQGNDKKIPRGKLIVFEGLDKSGKSTQSRKLKEALEKKGESQVVLWNFPDRSTQLGKVIDNYLNKSVELDDRAVHLLFSANRWEKVPNLIKLLQSGTTVIIDRYAFSGVAYSAAKGLPLKWCQQPDVGLPRPDSVIFLQLNPDVGAERNGFGDERYEKKQFQAKVLEEFLKIKDETWKMMDAKRSIEDLHREILNHIQTIPDEDLQSLWT